MKYQLDNPPTREAMIEEFGADSERLARAEASIRNCAMKADDFEHEKEHYSMCEVAYLLTAWGISDVFALLCTRLALNRGCIEVLADWPGGMSGGTCRVFRVHANFDASGALKKMTAVVDEGEPFGLGVDYLQFKPDDEIKSDDWRNAQRREIGDYELERRTVTKTHPPSFMTVIRYPLSCSQAYRKFIAERWYDPDVPNLDRFECPLDRAGFECFESYADSASERFEKALEIENKHRG